MDVEEQHNARKDALAFLTHHKTGVLATVSADGNAHASMVYYTADENFNVYILTLINSRKYQGLSEHPQVAFTVSTPDVPQTLQIEGMAMDISLDEDVAKKKDELFVVLNSNNWFYAPITKLDPAESVIVWIKPTWIRWADYAFEQSGNAHVLKEIPIISPMP
jgi:general stress protein 26